MRMLILAGAFMSLLCGASVHAQAPPRQPPASARAAAPIDLTGWWVAVITEDWRWRMVTPLRGDFANIPASPAAYPVGAAWDPTKDEAAGETCKAYGAQALLRRPGRLHIVWENDDTLRIDADEGTQTRLLRFGAAPGPSEPATLQGFSSARWEGPLRGEAPPEAFTIGTQPRAGAQGRALEVHTTRLQAGYLRANGIPYSDRAEVTEYFNTFKEPNGTEWFVVTTIVRDPVYLTGPYVTTSNFKREPDGAKFAPSPCRAR
jgi:hypothetical protein